MCLTGYLEYAGFFRWASWRTLQAARTPGGLLVGVALVAGVRSALVVNATVFRFVGTLGLPARGALAVVIVVPFVVVHGLPVTGAAAPILAPLAAAAGEGPLPLIVSWGAICVVASQLLSNVPYVMLVSQAVARTHDRTLAWEVLALASTLAGNLTLAGSVANRIVFSRAGQRGEIGFWRFLRVGLPATSGSLVVGLGLLWLVRVGLRS